MKVLYYFFGYPHLCKIAKHLQERHGWEPVYWVADSQVKDEVERAFPGICFQDKTRAERAIHTTELAHVKPAVLDQELIDALAVDQVTAMKIFYRSDATGHAFSLDDLIEFYYEALRFWLTVIREKKPDLFVCWTGPHGFEYVLYQLCKHLGIKVLFIDFAYAITKDTHLIASSIEDKGKLLKKKLEDTSIKYSPQKETLEQIRRQQGEYKIAMPDYMTAVQYFGESGKYLKKAFEMAKGIYSLIRHNPFAREDSFLKFKHGPYREERTGGNRLENYLYRRRVRKNAKRYKKIYNGYVVPADFSKKYVFFAASFQPEAATLPDAGVFNQLLLILEMLSEAIPDDWQIYYKEHPATLESIIWADLYRSAEYYERVSKISKLKMVDHRLDTFQLIDHSRFIATATGTAGWEAVVRGKPTLTFGETWYNPCEGVFQIKSMEQLRKVVDQIDAGYRPDPEQLFRFAGVVDQVCCKDLKYFEFKSRYSQIADIDEEMKRYAEFFVRAYDLYYSKGLKVGSQE